MNSLSSSTALNGTGPCSSGCSDQWGARRGCSLGGEIERERLDESRDRERVGERELERVGARELERVGARKPGRSNASAIDGERRNALDVPAPSEGPARMLAGSSSLASSSVSGRPRFNAEPPGGCSSWSSSTSSVFPSPSSPRWWPLSLVSLRSASCVACVRLKSFCRAASESQVSEAIKWSGW